MKIHLTYTDTFGEEPNYSWVFRKTLVLPDSATDAQIKRAAKKKMGISGLRGKWKFDNEFRPTGSCTVLFLSDGCDD